ncbi:MAG TPA: zinc-ribbon domain-containing protein [Acidimicrobiales bacterium]
MPYCGRCGHEVPSEFRFCPHCGADLASPGGPAVGGGGPSPAGGTSGPSGISGMSGGTGGPAPGMGTATMAATATRNPPAGPGGPGGPGGPSGAPAPQTQPVMATATPPTHRHRASIAPGLFLAAAGFVIVGFAYGALAYEAFTHVTLNLTRGSTVGFGAGFLVVGVGLVVLAVMRARE